MSINRVTFRPLSRIKSALVEPGRRPRRIPWGLYAGLTLHLDLATETQIYLGLWERETYRFIRSALSGCRWLIDIGAAKGELSVLWAAQPHVMKVIACEPLASEVDLLRANLQLNQPALKAPIDIVQKFVGTTGRRDTIPLDHLDVDRSCPGLIKIDVDGAEMDVLRSGRGLLECGAASLLVETHAKELERGCMELLADHGYRCSIVRNAWWRMVVPEQRDVEHNRWLWALPAGAVGATTAYR